MQTQKDKEIQSKLESAGNGLPKFDAIFLKYIGFPSLCTITSWDKALNLFEKEGEKVLKSVKGLDETRLFKKVLIPKIFGIEDNSRYYSPAMVLLHLIYVGETIQDGIIGLSKGKRQDLIVKIEDFKPFIEIDKNIVKKYETFLNNFRKKINENLGNKNSKMCLAHPWFGCLNAKKWLVLSFIHQQIHRRQIEKILNGENYAR